MFRSFFLAGFECATGYNKHNEWIDQVAATHHDRFVNEDYALLREVGLHGARESVRWPLVDRGGGKYDFSTIAPFIRASRENEVEVIWDLFHYGYPDGLDLFSAEFPRRFADYCHAVAKYISARTDGTCYFTPVNEPSFYSWAGGQVGQFAPHVKGRGGELKRRLMAAAIQGIEAIWAACPGARIVNVDPICRVVPALDEPHRRDEANHFNNCDVFECWDMLAGKLHPEMGGSPRHLDIIGINYYWTNQWEVGHPHRLLDPSDPRWWPLRNLVRLVWERYEQDVLITETSHRDEMRPAWVREVAADCEALLDEDVPLRGACLYPILGMPEWHAPDEWTRMGLWDLFPHEQGLKRVVHQEMLAALREAHRLDRRLERAEKRMLEQRHPEELTTSGRHSSRN